MSFDQRCRREVRGLHEFFQRWFTGGEASMDRLRSVLAPEFELVDPEGAVHAREDVLDRVEAARGSYPETFGIDVRDLRVLDRSPERRLVGYRERHRGPETDATRVSTALFEPHEDAPEGVRWRHLQETWAEG